MTTWYGATGFLTSTVSGEWPGATGANTNYVNLWRRAYADMIRMKAQQTESTLQGSVEQETIRGRSLVLDSWTNVTLVQRSRGQQYGAYTTGGDQNYSETVTERRQVEPEFWEYAEIFDPRDETALLRAIRPDGTYARTVASAFNRKKDEVIIAAFDATVNNYPSGTTAFNANMTIDFEYPTPGATGSSTGLTVSKLIEANRLLKANPVVANVGGILNDGDWHLAVHPNQIADLLGENSVTSADYNVVRSLVSGELNTYLGFNFHACPQIPDEGAGAFETGSTGKYVYAYHRTGMVFGMADDFMVRFDELPQRGYSLQAFHSFGVAAIRMDEAKVVRIECEDPAGASD